MDASLVHAAPVVFSIWSSDVEEMVGVEAANIQKTTIEQQMGLNPVDDMAVSGGISTANSHFCRALPALDHPSRWERR